MAKQNTPPKDTTVALIIIAVLVVIGHARQNNRKSNATADPMADFF